ncbi:MAG: ABC transporter permease, partial [Planctomycetota bacterium]
MSEPARGGTAADPGPVAGRSLWQDATRRLRRNRFAVAGGILVALLVVGAVVVPMLIDHTDQHTRAKYQPPSWSPNPLTEQVHLFGTDHLGRDLLARVFYGGRISLLIGFVGAAVAILIGTVYGAIAGYVGGRTDNLMMRFVDLLYGMPFMFIVILILSVVGRGLVPIFLALGCWMWLTPSV